mmetsp:Transcript_37209/g.42471  ORF Transcript_37209/g.42471 Transcript_37209/m.42471 type:complete len:536 (+) Transcript_37209:40-1647(+)
MKHLPRRRGGLKKGTHIPTILLVTVIMILLGIWGYISVSFYYSVNEYNREISGKEFPFEKPGELLVTQIAIPFPPKYPIVSRSQKLNQNILAMCERTLWHTLKTTTIVLPEAETFIYTGDIDDLWVRDSAAQVHPLLVPFGYKTKSLVQSDPRLARVVSGLIKRIAMYIRHDPYANAFRIDNTYIFSVDQKKMGRHDLISTWNYELDSACYYFRMIYYFFRALPHHPVLRMESVKEAVDIMIDLWISEQDHESDAYPDGPLLDCENCGRPYRYPGLARNGKGTQVAKVGMTWSGFRPSDDECKYGYLIPANMFAVVALKYVEELAPKLWNDKRMASKARKLRLEIDEGIQKYSIINHPKHGRIYAYEVDGLGNHSLMDDANVPSLMSIPYIGYDYIPEVYENTRRFILSTDNPTYRQGYSMETGEIEGYGSPHMNAAIKDNIWPMSLAVQALSSENIEEKLILVEKLTKATGGTGWMHESFDVSNPKKYTRKWFCWADSLYAELVMSLTEACPRGKYSVMKWLDPIDVPGDQYAA